MSKAIQRFSLDVTHPDVQASVRIMQGDDNRQWRFTFTEAGRPFILPARCTAMLVGTKPDDTVIENGLVVQGNEVIYDFGTADPENGIEQISTVPGSFEVQILLFDEYGAVLHAPRLWVTVFSSSYTERMANVSMDQFGGIKELIARLVGMEGDVETLLGRMTTSGTFVIPPTEWTDTQPYTALLLLSGLTEGTVTLFLPMDDATKQAAAEARMSMAVDSTQNNGVGGQYGVMTRIEGGTAPTIPLNFLYVILKTGSSNKALVAMVGVDAYGTGAGIDEARVNELISEALKDFTPEGGGSVGSISLVDDGEGNFSIVTTGGGTVNLVDDGEGNFTLIAN